MMDEDSIHRVIPHDTVLPSNPVNISFSVARCQDLQFHWRILRPVKAPRNVALWDWSLARWRCGKVVAQTTFFVHCLSVRTVWNHETSSIMESDTCGGHNERFATFSELHLNNLLDRKAAPGTKQQTKTAVSVFRTYLEEKGHATGNGIT